MEYKILLKDGMWKVYSGHISYGDWIKDDIVYQSAGLSNCYAWIKCKQEGFID